MSRAWKNAERRVARSFGTERTGPLGRNVPDAITGEYSVEVKSRKSLPAWLTGAMEQAERNAVCGTTPLVVLHRVGDRYENDLVIMRRRDFPPDVAKGADDDGT